MADARAHAISNVMSANRRRGGRRIQHRMCGHYAAKNLPEAEKK
jgi:hypothetical protein